MQGTSIGLIISVRDRRERMVDAPSILCRCSTVDSRTDQRMSELNMRAKVQEPGVSRRFDVSRRNSKNRCRTAKCVGIALRICCGDKEDYLRFSWQLLDLPQESRLDQITDGKGV